MIYGLHIRADNLCQPHEEDAPLIMTKRPVPEVTAFRRVIIQIWIILLCLMNELIMEQSAPRYARSVPIGTVKARLPNIYSRPAIDSSFAF
jgi:hypothetical protein